MATRIGILTGGGDCPGLNAVIRGAVAVLSAAGVEMTGFHDAWDGVLEDRYSVLTPASVLGIIHKGGTVLGTRRGSPLDFSDGPDVVRKRMQQHGLDGLIVVGGNGSLTVAHKLRDLAGLNVIGVPKTIDNDIQGTDVCFGFNTAVQIATDAIDRLHTTSESHDRIIIVEVMGRDAGWIAAHAALAGGACAVLVPEHPQSVEELSRLVRTHHGAGRTSSIVVAAEGAVKSYGSLSRLADELALGTGIETRTVALGYVQRGGTPTAYDRVLASAYGVAAADAALQGAWGSMTALVGGHMSGVDLSEVAGKTRLLDEATYDTMRRALI